MHARGSRRLPRGASFGALLATLLGIPAACESGSHRAAPAWVPARGDAASGADSLAGGAGRADDGPLGGATTDTEGASTSIGGTSARPTTPHGGAGASGGTRNQHDDGGTGVPEGGDVGAPSGSGAAGVAGETGGAGGGEPGPCAGKLDTDDDGVCDALDIDTDDDGVLDVDDRSTSGADWSRNPLLPEGGAGTAPSAVLATSCVQTSIAEANARLREQGLDELALVPDHRHWSYDLSGFYARVDAFAYFLAASDLTTGPAAGTELHNVHLDGVGENDQYLQWGVDVWNGSILNQWDGVPFTLRGTGDRFTMYGRGSGVVNLASGRVNPETGTIFDLRFLSLVQEPVDGACQWRLSAAPRTSRVARSDLTYLCRDLDDRFAAAPELWKPDAQCAEGRFAASADELPHSTACTAGLDSDGDGQLDCDEDDDDDDGVRDLDDRTLGGTTFALDPTRPGDEPSSAPNAIMNDSCVRNAIQASGWDPSTAPRGYEPAFLGFLREPVGAGYDTQTQAGPISPIVPATGGFELEVHRLGGDRTTQMGHVFSAQGTLDPFIHRDVIGRSGGQRYARFKRFPAYGQAQLIQGTIDADGFTGDYLLVGVPPWPVKTCPSGSAGWYTRGVEHYLRVTAHELEHVCIDEGHLRVAGQTWYRSDHAFCTCSSDEQVSCNQ